MQLFTCLLTAVDAFAMPRHAHINAMRSVRDCWTVALLESSLHAASRVWPSPGSRSRLLSSHYWGSIPADDYGRR
ncbi:hypothetical protein BDW72DRAFT_176643 [Aspergillus terricola var. indicus]